MGEGGREGVDSKSEKVKRGGCGAQALVFVPLGQGPGKIRSRFLATSPGPWDGSKSLAANPGPWVGVGGQVALLSGKDRVVGP